MRWLILAAVPGDRPLTTEQGRNILVVGLLVLVVWQVGMRTLAWLSGWRSAARRYSRAVSEEAGLHRTSVLAVFRRGMSVWYFPLASAHSGALVLGLPMVYSGHADLAIPWESLHLSTVVADGVEWSEATLAEVPSVSLRIRSTALARLRAKPRSSDARSSST